MTKDDKDRMYTAMVEWNDINKWLADEESELDAKDKQKLRAISNMLLELFKQFRKKMGDVVFKSMLEESRNFKFYIAGADTEVDNELTNSFDETIYKNVIESILEKNELECMLCTRTDFKNCDLYSLHKLVTNNSEACKTCPFKRSSFYEDKD